MNQIKHKIEFGGDKFCIEEGLFILVCGKTGSGKTTFLNRVEQQLSQEGCKTGFVFQDFDAQIVTDKVWHELAFGLENNGFKRSLMERRVAEVSTYFGISDWLSTNTDSLSGGQKQLLNLASTMALSPDFLLLDEPLSQLDPIAAGNFLNTVKKINREFGITVVMSEHRLEEVFADCDRLVFLDDMKILFCGEAKKVCRSICDYSKDGENVFFDFLPAPARLCSKIVLKEGIEDLPLSVAEGKKFIKERRDCFAKEFCTEKSKDSDVSAPDKKEDLIFVKELSFRYSKKSDWVLQELSFGIKENSISAIVGSNGSGKSTLLKLLSKILTPTSGTIRVDSSAKDKICLLPQNVRNLFTKHTVLQELEDCGFCADCKNLGEEVKSLIAYLKEKFSAHPYDLSGGEMQKLALAKLLLKKPKVLLLDEPTKALDNSYKKELSGLLKSLAKSGLSVVMVCHDLEFCAYTAHSVSLMFEGKLVGSGSAEEFFKENNFYTTAINRLCRGIF